MAIEFDVFPAQRLIRVRLNDTLSVRALRELLSLRNVHPDFRPEYRRLVDARQLVVVPHGPEMKELAEMMMQANPARAPLAFVADRDAVFGMFRMLETVSDAKGFSHRAFRTMREAEAWLGIEPCTA